jgi:hypothetical protein
MSLYVYVAFHTAWRQRLRCQTAILSYDAWQVASKENDTIVVVVCVKYLLDIISSLITFKVIFESYKVPDIHKSAAQLFQGLGKALRSGSINLQMILWVRKNCPHWKGPCVINFRLGLCVCFFHRESRCVLCGLPGFLPPVWEVLLLSVQSDKV